MSDEAAQVQYDFITGNFGEQSGSPTLATMFRAAGFFNPGIQILVQTYGKAFNPNPRVRGELALKMGWLAAIGAVTAAINYLLMDDDDKEQMRERTDEDRGRYMNIAVPFFKGVRLRMPFDYGPAGAATSMGWNLVEGHLLGDGVDGGTLAWAILERSLSLPAVSDVLGPQIKMVLELSAGESGYSAFFNAPSVERVLIRNNVFTGTNTFQHIGAKINGDWNENANRNPRSQELFDIVIAGNRFETGTRAVALFEVDNADGLTIRNNTKGVGQLLWDGGPNVNVTEQ